MTLLEEALVAQRRGLTDFGYEGLTMETFRAAHANWKAGKEPDGVIEMFAFKDYDERPELFGEKD